MNIVTHLQMIYMSLYTLFYVVLPLPQVSNVISVLETLMSMLSTIVITFLSAIQLLEYLNKLLNKYLNFPRFCGVVKTEDILFQREKKSTPKKTYTQELKR
jgi:hypothetical protein